MARQCIGLKIPGNVQEASVCKKIGAARLFYVRSAPCGRPALAKNGQLVLTSVLQDRARNLTTALPLLWQFLATRALLLSASTSVVGACRLPARSARWLSRQRHASGRSKGPLPTLGKLLCSVEVSHCPAPLPCHCTSILYAPVATVLLNLGRH